MDLDWSEYNKLTSEERKLRGTKKLIDKRIKEISLLKIPIHEKNCEKIRIGNVELGRTT